MQRKVEALLKEYAYRRKKRSEAMPANAAVYYGSELLDDEVQGGLKSADELVSRPGMAMAEEELLRRRNRQIRNKQRSWQESEEGQKMLAFRKTLPAYKERDALLEAMARNQVLTLLIAILFTTGS